jgi:SAM-dependent methyltransferase
VRRWTHLLPDGASVLDVACGSGRHVRWFAERGHPVTALDRDAQALQPLQGLAELIVADIEGEAWPLVARRFGAVVVTNYLHRPLWPALLDALREGGVLIYETFADGQQAYGRPSNPDFLLRPGELLAVAHGLQVVAYEHGVETDPLRVVQRLVAVKVPPHPPESPRFALAPTSKSDGG